MGATPWTQPRHPQDTHLPAYSHSCARATDLHKNTVSRGEHRALGVRGVHVLPHTIPPLAPRSLTRLSIPDLRCDARMQADLKRAAEHICAQRPPAQASAAETAIGFNPLSLARWTAGRSEAWLDYTEDGPWEIARLLRKKMLRRAGAGAQAPAVRGQGGDRGEGEGAAAAAGRYGNLDCAHALAPGLSSGMPAVGEAAPALSPPLAAPQPMSPPHSTPIHARMLPKTPRFELSSPDFSSPSDSTPGLPSVGKPTPDASPASPAAPPFAAGPTAATLVPNLMD